MKRTCVVLLLCVASMCGFLAWAGYFSDEPFTLVMPPKLATTNGPHVSVIYFSGDVGYKVALGREISDRLALDGIPVLAVNSLGFFRTKRSVPEVTELISKAIVEALKSGHADEVVLIGHSFGADALQAGLMGLPAQLRLRVRAVILIVPTKALYLQISPIEMLDWFEPDAATLPTLQQLNWVPFTCISGVDEDASPCPLLKGTNVRRIALPGGHTLDWNNEAIHHAILGAIDAAAFRNITKNSDHSHELPVQTGLQAKE